MSDKYYDCTHGDTDKLIRDLEEANPDERFQMELDLTKHICNKSREALVEVMLRTSKDDLDFMLPNKDTYELLTVSIRVPKNFSNGLLQQAALCDHCSLKEKVCFRNEDFIALLFKTALCDCVSNHLDIKADVIGSLSKVTELLKKHLRERK